MKPMRVHLAVIAMMAFSSAASAGIISSGVYANDAAFSVASGASSLTGTLPDLVGAQEKIVTLGGATLAAGNTIFVGSGWSTLLPGGNAIAVSGRENLDISVDTGASTAFGFYFHEPSNSTAMLDGCNTTCVDSVFNISFSLGGNYVDDLDFISPKDQQVFFGAILNETFDAVAVTETTGGIDNEFFGEMFVARQVPEPGSVLLLLAGLAGLSAAARRKRFH